MAGSSKFVFVWLRAAAHIRLLSNIDGPPAARFIRPPFERTLRASMNKTVVQKTS